MNKRKAISKKVRQSVYLMYNGHCAYCGTEIAYKDMQVDHATPLRIGGADDISNYMPACRSCNHYKSKSTLEGFRKMVENMPAVLMRDSVTYKNAVRFGLVTPTPHPVKFYFEQLFIEKRGEEIRVTPVNERRRTNDK